MVGPACINEEDLRAYLVGRLSPRVAQLIDDHLAACPHCAVQARELDWQSDPLVCSLRRAAGCAGEGSTALLMRQSGPSPAPAPRQAGPALPLRVAGCEVLGEVGRGGMSVVYQARQLHPDRLVALKMLLAGSHADPARRARLVAEANAIARLRHPNIVQVYGVGEHDGLPILILEYVGGGSLAQRLAGLPQPTEQAAALLETLARAVQHSHEHGVIHRDLKPANVLLTEEGQPKVSDFGLAKHERPELTATGTVLGTPSYMAPEQAGGDSHGVGPAADVYALGAILYECLTGRPPFRAATVLKTLEQLRSQEPVSPSRLRARLPRDLDTICMKCLAKEPHRRYPSAGALADDLRRFLDGRPVLARPSGPVGHLWRWGRRNPGWAAMLLTLAALLLVILVGGAIGLVRLNDALHQARAAERATEEQLFESLLAQARGQCLSRRCGQRFESLQTVARATKLARRLQLPPERFLELRNAAILALSLPDLHVGQTVNVPRGTPGMVDFDEDFATYTWIDRQGSWEVRRVADDRLLYRRPPPAASGPEATAHTHEANSSAAGDGSWPILSRDGRFLAACRHLPGARPGPAQVWRLGNASPPELLFVAQNVATGDFDRDSRRLALGHADGSASVYAVHPQQPARLLRRFPPGPIKRDAWVALHPSKPWLAVGSYFANAVEVRDYRSGAVVVTLPQPGNVSQVAWHPDGRLLAVTDGDGRDIRLYETAAWEQGTATLPKRTLTAEGWGTSAAFNPSGDRLAASDWAGCVQLFDLGTGKLLVKTPPSHMPMQRLRFSRDGRRLAGGWFGEQIGIWDIGDAREHRTLAQLGGGARRSGRQGPSPDVSAERYGPPCVWTDSRLLAVPLEGRSWRWRLWDLGTGEEAGSLPGDSHGEAHFLPPGPTAPGALVMDAPAGMVRWPIEPSRKSPATLRIGPPQQLSPIHALWTDHSSDGRLLAGSSRKVGRYQKDAGCWVLPMDQPNRPLLHLLPGTDCSHVAISPGGDLVVTSPHLFGVNRVWHVPDGRLVKELLDTPAGTVPRFSPDGKWLSVSGDPGALYAVGTWERRLRFSGWAEFSPDSRLLAVNTYRGPIRLLDIASGAELAELASTEEKESRHVFTPDGTRIIFTTSGKEGGIHVWDLRALRRQLRLLDLDWDAPDYPPEEEHPSSPLRLEIVP